MPQGFAPPLLTPPLLAQLESDSLASAGLLCLGILLISAWLLMRTRKRQRQGTGHTTAREQIERYRQHDGVKNDLESLMVDIEQLAKRLGAQLDAKALALERRIDEADLRIAQLHEAMRQEHSAPHAAAPTLPAAAAPPHATAERGLPSEAAATSPGITPGTAPGIAPGNVLGDAPGTPSPDPLTANIYRLADQGLPPAQIAQQLHEHVGKVELILALRQA